MGRHNAGRPVFEVEISYPFHPLFRRIAMVVRTQVHDNIQHLTVCASDGSSFLLPEWMTTSEAASFAIRLDPVLPLKQLFELRGILDSVLAASNGAPQPRGGDDDKVADCSTRFVPVSAQPDRIGTNPAAESRDAPSNAVDGSQRRRIGSSQRARNVGGER
jgi:hypothetical protein